jgi:hypothetical protein
MNMREKILRLVHPEMGGPRSRRVLEAAASNGGRDGKTFIAGMIERGELLKYGDRKGARYGLPRVRA